MQMLARPARLLLVLALLAGWQAALLHPLQHRDENGRYVHLGVPDSGKGQPGKFFACDALASLAACAPGTPAGWPPLCGRQDLPATADFAARLAAAAPPFLAPGPPALLGSGLARAGRAARPPPRPR